MSYDLKRLLADLRRDLNANAEDIRATSERLEELYRERIVLYHGIADIEQELKRLEESE